LSVQPAEFLNRNDCFLLVVDIQQTILDKCVEEERLRQNAAALIDVAGVMSVPVLFSVHNPEKLGSVLPELTDRITLPAVFEKLTFSCFGDEVLADAMSRLGRRTMVLAGLESHICIFQTGAHALRLGYGVHVATDAVTSRSYLNWDVGLRRLGEAGAVLSSTEMIIYELLGRAGTSEFRAVLPLLRTLS
jgi:nicotinamidase-related amidase